MKKTYPPHPYLEEIKALTELWQLKNCQLFYKGPSSRLFYAQYGKKIVLLKQFSHAKEFLKEKQALDTFKSPYYVSYEKASSSYNALLLEYIGQGKTLSDWFFKKENKSIKLYAALIEKLFSNLYPPSLETSSSLMSTLKRYLDQLSPSHSHYKEIQFLLPTAISYLEEKEKQLFFIHGDLHSKNLIFSSDNDLGLKVIDPKFYIGSLEDEMAVFIINPIEKILCSHHYVYSQAYFVKKIIKNRFKLFSKILQREENELFKRTFLRLILNALWSLEDKDYRSFFNWRDLAYEIGEGY